MKVKWCGGEKCVSCEQPSKSCREETKPTSSALEGHKWSLLQPGKKEKPLCTPMTCKRPINDSDGDIRDFESSDDSRNYLTIGIGDLAKCKL